MDGARCGARRRAPRGAPGAPATPTWTAQVARPAHRHPHKPCPPDTLCRGALAGASRSIGLAGRGAPAVARCPTGVRGGRLHRAGRERRVSAGGGEVDRELSPAAHARGGRRRAPRRRGAPLPLIPVALTRPPLRMRAKLAGSARRLSAGRRVARPPRPPRRGRAGTPPRRRCPAAGRGARRPGAARDPPSSPAFRTVGRRPPWTARLSPRRRAGGAVPSPRDPRAAVRSRGRLLPPPPSFRPVAPPRPGGRPAPAPGDLGGSNPARSAGRPPPRCRRNLGLRRNFIRALPARGRYPCAAPTGPAAGEAPAGIMLS